MTIPKPKPIDHAETTWWLSAAGFGLPLLWWGGLENPFVVPKLLLVAGLDLAVGVRLLQTRKLRLQESSTCWPWLLWLGTVALSATIGRYVSMEALLLTLLPLPLAWALFSGVLPAHPLQRGLLWGSVAESVIALSQYFGLDPLALLWRPDLTGSSRMRVYGTLGNPDFVAAWLCATLPLYVHVPGKGPKRLLWGVLLALQAGAIFVTGSRMFLVALPAVAVALALRGSRRMRVCMAGLPLVAALLWFSPARPLGVTVQGRWYLARVTLDHWRQVPVFGFGPGSYRLQFAPWQTEYLSGQGERTNSLQFAGLVDHAHNDYLELWVEYGWAGLTAFLILTYWLMRRAWRLGTNQSLSCSGSSWAGVAVLLAIAVIDFPLHRPAEWALYWMFVGMLGGGGPDRRRNNN
ncbi:MAG: O-antigen ligase family protein [Bryobacteraceae bacterium]